MPNPKPKHKWKSGESGNPNGRPPKGQTLTEALEKAVDKDELAQLIRNMAFENGDFQAAKYIYDRIDGTPKQTIDQNVYQEFPQGAVLVRDIVDWARGTDK